MGTAVSIGRRVWTGIGALLLSACAGMGPGALTPGVSTGPEVEARLGQPAKTWQNADGSRQLAFVSGPGGTQTFMAFIGPDGKLTRLVGVLNEYYFNLIRPGMTQDEVLALLGPADGIHERRWVYDMGLQLIDHVFLELFFNEEGILVEILEVQG